MVAKEMADHEIGSLPVTREGKYIGIITETGMKDMAGFFSARPSRTSE